MTQHTDDTLEFGWALALAARRPGRRRRHPRPPDRRLRDRLPPRRALRRTASGAGEDGHHDNLIHTHDDYDVASTGTGHSDPRPHRRRQDAVHERQLLRLPLTHRRRRCRPQLQGPRRRDDDAQYRRDSHRRRRLSRALDRRPRRADRQGLYRGADGPGDRKLRPCSQARRHPRARRVHQVAEVAPPGVAAGVDGVASP